MEKNLTYLELAANGDFIKIELDELLYPNSESDWDRNWIGSIVTVKAGGFSGKFNANLMTIDFENFKQNLTQLYDKLDETVIFNSLEDFVEIKISGDGVGHLEARCELMDNSDPRNILRFNIYFDQTQIPEWIKQLERITKEFPTIGRLI